MDTRKDLAHCSPKMELGKISFSVMKVQVGNKQQLKRRENTLLQNLKYPAFVKRSKTHGSKYSRTSKSQNDDLFQKLRNHVPKEMIHNFLHTL
jgi:hypothetical protein